MSNVLFPSAGLVQGVQPGDYVMLNPLKTDLNFLNGKFDNTSGHNHDGTAGSGGILATEDKDIYTLLKNGSFEEIDNNLPTNWTIAYHPGGTGAVKEALVPGVGKRSWMFQTTGTTGEGGGKIESDAISLPTFCQDYKMHIVMYQTIIDLGVKISIKCYDAGNALLSEISLLDSNSLNLNDYTIDHAGVICRKFRFSTPSNTTSIKVCLEGGKIGSQAGQVYFDYVGIVTDSIKKALIWTFPETSLSFVIPENWTDLSGVKWSLSPSMKPETVFKLNFNIRFKMSTTTAFKIRFRIEDFVSTEREVHVSEYIDADFSFPEINFPPSSVDIYTTPANTPPSPLTMYLQAGYLQNFGYNATLFVDRPAGTKGYITYYL